MVRDLLMVAIFCGVLPFVLTRPWLGVLLWTWVSIMNPHKLAWGFATDAPFAAAAAGATLLSLLVSKHRLRMPTGPPVVTLFAFVAWMCLTTLLAFYPGESLIQLNKVLKIQLMTLVAFAALQERKHIELFVWVNVLSLGFYGVKGGIFTITRDGAERVWGPPGGFIAGNNEIGLALVMAIPLMNYLRVTSQRAWIRYAMLAAMALSATAALGTQSRGAFLAICAMGIVLWVRSRNKSISAAAIALLGYLLFTFMPATWFARMQTIMKYDEDGSALGRLNAWRMAFNLANERLFGGGFEIYAADVFARFAPVGDNVRAAHSIYFQVLGEHGYPGLLLFLLLGWLAFRTANRIRREALKQEETQWLHPLAGMIQVSLVGYAVGGAFLSLTYFDLPYNMLVVLVVSWRWLQDKRWETDTSWPSMRAKSGAKSNEVASNAAVPARLADATDRRSAG